MWFFCSFALWHPALRTCQTAPAPNNPSPCHTRVTSPLYTCLHAAGRRLQKRAWLLSSTCWLTRGERSDSSCTSETVTPERGAELWPAGLANVDPGHRSNYQLCQIRALLSSSLSLSLSLSSSHPPLALSSLSWAHRCKKTPAPTGEIGREGGGMWSRRRGSQRSVNWKAVRVRASPWKESRRDKTRFSSASWARARSRQRRSNLVNFRPSVRKTCRAELWADKALWPTCYIKLDFVFCVLL